MFNFFKKKDDSPAKNEKTGFDRLKNALSKTAGVIMGGVLNKTSEDKLSEFDIEEIETNLIKADLGLDLTTEIVEKIQTQKLKNSELKDFLKREFTDILNTPSNDKLKFDKEKLNVYLVVGVNGAGKTTLIGKLAHRFKSEGAKVLLAAGDTFRAAAEEQLDIWSKRAGVEILREDKGNSASIAFKAIDKARSENFNVVIIDTAGRLQNKYNLIEELKKIKNVVSKKIENDNLETILVLDGTQGQNGLNQAQVFSKALDLTSVAITKLDGSSKGGIILSIARDLKLPTKIVGIGEGINDIADFNKDDFINALF